MLNNIDKNNPFNVPDNYFQNLSSEIMSQLPEKEKKKKVISLWQTVAKWSAVAAAIMGLAVIGIDQIDSSSNNTSNPLEKRVANEDQLASIQDDYYLFLEDEATQVMYNDSFFPDQL